MSSPKQTMVAIAAGPDYTSVLATIAAHYVKLYQDGDRIDAFEYKLPGDDFTQVYKTQDGGTINGDAIELLGNGRSGILQPPPNYFASGVPATGGIYIKIRQSGGGGAGTNMVLLESVSEL